MNQKNYAALFEYFQDVYRQNAFVRMLSIKLERVEPGLAEVSMPVFASTHTNLHGVSHGGCLASVADTAMGAACSSLGRRVVTLDMNMNFIKAAPADTEVRAIGRVIHNGRQTLVAECDVTGVEERLLVRARGTFFVVGQFDIPGNMVEKQTTGGT